MMKMVRRKDQFILGTFVVLWVGVLPWLCWGGWSNPAHPHPNPHFVFAQPTFFKVASSQKVTSHLHVEHDEHGQAEQADPVAGVGRPDTLLIMLLALLVPAFRLHTVALRPHFTRHASTRWARLPVMPVPTPPPQNPHA
jgi:hypothetical protein